MVIGTHLGGNWRRKQSDAQQPDPSYSSFPTWGHPFLSITLHLNRGKNGINTTQEAH